MKEIFLDLIQTPSVVIPVFLIVLTLAGFGALTYLLLHRPNANDESMARDYDQQMRTQEQRLSYFYEHGDLPPARERMNALNRGIATPASRHFGDQATLPVGLLIQAFDDGLGATISHDGDQLVLTDFELPALDPVRSVFILPIKVIAECEGNYKRLTRRARKAINARAIKVGINPIKRYSGRPAHRGVTN